MPTATDPRQSTAPRCETIPSPSQDAFIALVGRAEEGDDDALAELQRLLDYDDELCQPLSDISRLVEQRLLGLAAGDSKLMRWKIERFIANFRGGLMDGAGDPIEAFLIHRIVVSYLEVMIRMNDASKLGGTARELALERAQRRQITFVAAFRDYHAIRQMGSEASFR
jgi:hypothetical protein